MFVNTDFSRRTIVEPQHYQWSASPRSGVERVLLDRLGGEKARATSIVRYAPGSYYPRHGHPGGEEILVLSGTFSEEGEHYPQGWYLRNPPGSMHEPSSADGTVLFVKLWQMRPDEQRRVRIDTGNPGAWQHLNGREVCPLFSDGTEQVCLQRLQPGDAPFAEPAGGAELLVLAGSVVVVGKARERGSWMRFPAGDCPRVAAGADGATVYLKTGHLAGMAGEREA